MTTIQDITSTTVSNLSSLEYIDKTRGAQIFTESSDAIPITSETDRVYKDVSPDSPVVVSVNRNPRFAVKRDGLNDVVVWNPWVEKAAGMSDFGPKDGYKNMSEFNLLNGASRGAANLFAKSVSKLDPSQRGRN
jgi:glucose-6-phosphate 1-epimerase